MKAISKNFYSFRIFVYVAMVHIVFLFFLGFLERGPQKEKYKPVVVREFLEKKPLLLTSKTVVTEKSKKAKIAPLPLAMQQSTSLNTSQSPIGSSQKPSTKSSPSTPKSSTFISSSSSVKNRSSSLSKEKGTKNLHTELSSQTLSLIKRLEEELSSIPSHATSMGQEGQKLMIPKEIQSMKSLAWVDSDASEDDQERLIQELQHQLRLPEYGQVVCSFTIDENGGIVDLRFDAYKNKENLEYLKKTLPLVSFPWFNGQKNKEQRFHVTFSNEITK